MAFWGNAFIYGGIPCEDYDLMLYDVGGTSQSSGTFASGVSVIEEPIVSRWKPYFYGTKIEKKLEFSIVFGLNQKRIDSGKSFDRYELETIASWLTGHNKYLWLEIEQEDMEYVRYNAIFTGLEVIEYGNIPWALKASIVCDSPYAYLYPQEFTYEIDGTQEFIFFNESTHNGYYKPKIEISLNGGSDFSIINQSDNNRASVFTDIPGSISKIYIDSDHCVITNDQNLNIYKNFNFNFFRLIKGENELKITGNGILKIICEFPVNIGG